MIKFLIILLVFKILKGSHAQSLYITGVWKQYGTDRYILNKNYDNVWYEIVNGQILKTYQLDERHNDYILLNDNETRYFYKLAEDGLFEFISDRMEEKSNLESYGQWIVKPNILSYEHEINLNLDVKEYTVKLGDTLWNIANTLCNNPMLYKKIADENNIPDPNLIFPDQRLLIKCKSKKSASEVVKKPLNAKWVWENETNHYIVNSKNSDKWYEVKNGEIENEFKHVRYEKSNPVIYDEKHNIYMKIFEKAIISLDDAENIDSEEEIANGYWQIKPSNVPRKKSQQNELNLNAKWVWEKEPNRYISNERNNKWWQEYKDGKKQAELVFVKYDGSDVILADSTLGVYVKLTSGRIIYSFNGIDGLGRNPSIYMNGKWEIKPKITAKICGIPKIKARGESGKFNFRILGGSPATPYSWPWQVLIDLYYGPFRRKCSGSLISNEWILTAAHCVFDNDLGQPTRIKVYIGIYDQKKELKDENLYNVSDIIKHSEFNYEMRKNDLALLKLAKPVTFSDKIQPICLPSNNHLLPGQQATVTGWGLTEDRATSDRLMQVNLPIRQISYCELPGMDMTSQICAGDVNKDSCSGDSGGPMIMPSDSDPFQYVLVGVVSLGQNDPCDGKGIYTNVAAFTHWILNTVQLSMDYFISY